MFTFWPYHKIMQKCYNMSNFGRVTNENTENNFQKIFGRVFSLLHP